MREWTERALNLAEVKGATYADIRIVRRETQDITVKNGIVQRLALDTTHGFGVRVIADGAWGFASSHALDPDEIDRVTAQAVGIARASAMTKAQDIDLGPPEVHVGRYRTPVEMDPFDVSLEDKIGLLLQADREARGVPGVAVATASMAFWRESKTFASSEGSYIEQEIIESGGGVSAVAVAEGEMQRRSYPNAFGGDQATAGYEFVERYDLVGNARRVGEEAVALLSAPQCPSGVTTLILDGSQLALQIHESCGHPIELDRVFGTEAAFAGTSFLTPEKVGSFRYGCDRVHITADSTSPGGLGTFGYDDEGVPAGKTDIVRNGIFVGYLTSRETATQLRRIHPDAPARSNGAMRADGWNRIPLIRMTNVNLLPKPGMSFDDIVADTDDGLLFETNRSWSIDDRRLNFQFSTEICREVKGGRLARLYRNGTYTGITYELWRSMDAVGDASSWAMWGTPNCGKGEPSQAGHVGHGVSGARFRNVRVGVMA